MILLTVAFVGGLGLLAWGVKNMQSVPSISLPLPPQPTPTAIPPSPSPESQGFEAIEKDLLMIEADLKKMKEDNRLDPPVFIFDLKLE